MSRYPDFAKAVSQDSILGSFCFLLVICAVVCVILAAVLKSVALLLVVVLILAVLNLGAIMYLRLKWPYFYR